MSFERLFHRLREEAPLHDTPVLLGLLQSEEILLIDLLQEVERLTRKEQLVITIVTTNDNAVLLRPSGLDRDKVGIDTSALTIAVDKPDVASCGPDPANPGCFLVTPLAATDPAVGSRTVIATLTDPATSLTVQASIEFTPGAEASLEVTAEAVPIPATSATPPTEDPNATPST